METPRGLEVLLKKAPVDTEFRRLLLENRSAAGAVIGLELDPAEAAMLDAMPSDQLDAIIRQTHVRPEERRIFLGKAASVMLATLMAGVSGCAKKEPPGSRGHAADYPERARRARPQSPSTPPERDTGPAATT